MIDYTWVNFDLAMIGISIFVGLGIWIILTIITLVGK